jgi:hypothetical protein
MGPSENPTAHPENQEAGRRKRLPCRPRMRRCLLKGCERRFHPRQARQRYCSGRCREAARKWSRWEGAAKIPGGEGGQSETERPKSALSGARPERKPPTPEAVGEAARVITNNSFRSMLRPARLLRAIRAPAAKSLAALLLARVPACPGTRPGAGAALETGTDLIRRY